MKPPTPDDERPGAKLRGFGPRLRRIAAQVALVGWVPLVLVPSTYLLSFHTLGLPSGASSNATIATSFARSRTPSEKQGWLVAHVLSTECGCSKRIGAHLVERGARHDLTERVLLVGDDANLSNELATAGFEVERLTPDQLEERYGLTSAPILVAIDDAGDLAYLGGYTEQKQGPLVADVDIIDALVAGRQVTPLPILGCAVGRDLKRRADPLGLKD